MRLFFQPGESLVRRQAVSLDVALAEPLGARRLLAAWTGTDRAEVERRPGDPVPAEAGTPLWRSA